MEPNHCATETQRFVLDFQHTSDIHFIYEDNDVADYNEPCIDLLRCRHCHRIVKSGFADIHLSLVQQCNVICFSAAVHILWPFPENRKMRNLGVQFA